MDHVIKRGEHADAGIRHYWIVDLDPPPSATTDGSTHGTGTPHVTERCDLTVELAALR
jgi:hypothetical protein